MNGSEAVWKTEEFDRIVNKKAAEEYPFRRGRRFVRFVQGR